MHVHYRYINSSLCLAQFLAQNCMFQNVKEKGRKGKGREGRKDGWTKGGREGRERKEENPFYTNYIMHSNAHL